jgi:predicted secreted protein
MNKLLKTIAPVVLSVFCCTAVVGLAWGEDNFPISVNAPESVEVGKNFNVEIAFSKQAITSKELYLSIEFSKELNISPISTPITKESYQFSFNAPTQESTLTIGIVVTENEAIISHKTIQVKAYKAADLNPVVAVAIVTIGIFAGVVSFLAKLIAPGILGMH